VSYRYVGELDAEVIALGYLLRAEGGRATASEIDSLMLRFGDESMALRDVEAALVRCLIKGEVVRVASPLAVYEITKKGRERREHGP
jgi:DNA-binding transcriptional regulator PaaX